MFCIKCGNKALEEAEFCPKCGAKIINDESVKQPPVEPVSRRPITTVQNTNDFAELVVTSVKVEGQPDSIKFDVILDGIKIGRLSNGGTSTYKITPGQHCVKIGRCSICIDIPKGNTPVTLRWKWGGDYLFKPEIVCNQAHLVTKPSEIEKMNSLGKAGIGCIVAGIIGVIIGFLLNESLDGPIVSAEAHAMLDNTVSNTLMVGGFVLVLIGAIIMILSLRIKKK